MTEGLMLALTAKGMPRSEAHELLRRLSRDAGDGSTLATRAGQDPTVLSHLSAGEVAALLSPQTYVDAAAAKTDRVVTGLRDRLRR